MNASHYSSRKSCSMSISGEKSGICTLTMLHHPQSLYGYYWLWTRKTTATETSLLMLLLLFLTNCAAALSSSSSCKIVGTSVGTTQYLPTSYVATFGRWIVVNHQLKPLLPPSTVSSAASVPSPPEEGRSSRSRAAVVAVQATLDILVKSGTPTYIMAGLQVQQQQHSISGQPPYSTVASPWTAHQWVTFGSVVEPDFRVILFQNGNADSENESKILAVATTDDIRVALEDLGLALQEQQQEQSPLEQGFHIVSLPLQMTKTSRDVTTMDNKENSSSSISSDDTCTDDSNSKKKKLDWIPVNLDTPATTTSTTLTCLATAEVNARELLSLDPTLLEMTVTSILQVPISQVQQHYNMN
jgi:hypothetical protein